jgi:hypothetical protein
MTQKPIYMTYIQATLLVLLVGAVIAASGILYVFEHTGGQ